MREAICCYIGKSIHGKVESDPALPFFEAKPDQEYDLYYCGCYGWD